MTLPSWYASLATSRPDLFRLIYDFNTRPQDWVHPSRAKALPHGPVIDFLSHKGHGRRLLGRWIFEKFGIAQHQTWWDFVEERRRLALLEHGALEQVALYCGVTLRWRQIKSIISRDEVLQLKTRLGPEAHSFALQRGPLLKVPQLLRQTPAPAAIADDSGSKEDLPEVIWREGWTALVKSLAGETEPLLQRFWLKVPQDTQERHGLAALPAKTPAELRDANWLFVRRIAHEILSDQELQCFA